MKIYCRKGEREREKLKRAFESAERVIEKGERETQQKTAGKVCYAENGREGV